jgi:hypothetical protein
MVFPKRNPWIDERYKLVTSSLADAYMRRHGWVPVPFSRPELKKYEGPRADDGEPISQFVPLVERSRDFHRCILDLIENLAIVENRHAVDVLEEMLGIASPSENGSANGQPTADKTPAPAPSI